MDSLYLLLPMSVLLVLALIGLFAWALNGGQFDDLEREGWRIVEEKAVEGQGAEPRPEP
jgi:cbb3-type cytochrome oxidase maturation protein